MNFCYEGAELDKIIKRYKKDGNEYTILYMDGSVSSYFSNEENEENIIKEKMIEQAKERDAVYNLNQLQPVTNKNLVGVISSAIGLGVGEIADADLLKLAAIFLLGFNISNVNSNKKKINELKKYKLFLELLEKVGEKELNSPKYTRSYEFDNLYTSLLYLIN